MFILEAKCLLLGWRCGEASDVQSKALVVFGKAFRYLAKDSSFLGKGLGALCNAAGTSGKVSRATGKMTGGLLMSGEEASCL